MNYKKKYDEALERAKSFKAPELRDVAEYIFPELKESEDERTRKELITHCRNTRCVTEEGAERIAKWIDWLEKQGEQNLDWSEEDKRILDALITSLINERFAGRLEFLKGIKVSSVIDWLKSLKEKIKKETV